MATSYKETAKLGHNFKIDGKGPIDVRFVVANKSSLTDGTFTYENSYNMLMVGVEADKSIYVLTNASAPTQSNSWQKLASASDLSGLSGVFKFKGVAESINEAQIIITLSSATATKGSDTYTVKCQTIAYEYDMDIYYGWGATADSILFWTDTPTLTSTSIQYGVTAPTSVKKLVLNGEDYYIADRTVPAGDGLSQWENISGKVVYCNETTSKVYSEDQEDPKYELGVAEIVTYNAFDFAPLSASDKYTVSDVASATVAAADNAGHVYQIGENEYASNGIIWVKLGAPTENWIVL